MKNSNWRGERTGMPLIICTVPTCLFKFTLGWFAPLQLIVWEINWRTPPNLQIFDDFRWRIRLRSHRPFQECGGKKSDRYQMLPQILKNWWWILIDFKFVWWSSKLKHTADVTTVKSRRFSVKKPLSQQTLALLWMTGQYFVQKARKHSDRVKSWCIWEFVVFPGRIILRTSVSVAFAIKKLLTQRIT